MGLHGYRQNTQLERLAKSATQNSMSPWNLAIYQQTGESSLGLSLIIRYKPFLQQYKMIGKRYA
jgi:hypothetical protein